jgi:hypothetical protein
MVKKLLCLIFLLTLSHTVFSQDDQDVRDLEILEGALMGIHDVVASPNPFSVTTRIRFFSDEEYEMDFLVKDLLGNTIYSKKMTTKKGHNTIPFFRDDLESGIYIYSLKTKTKVISKRIVIK